MNYEKYHAIRKTADIVYVKVARSILSKLSKAGANVVVKNTYTKGGNVYGYNYIAHVAKNNDGLEAIKFLRSAGIPITLYGRGSRKNANNHNRDLRVNDVEVDSYAIYVRNESVANLATKLSN